MMRRGIAFALSSAFLVAACSIGEANQNREVYPARVASEVRTCAPPFANPDIGSLKPCGGGDRGKGHCYDGSKTAVAGFMPCEGTEVCMPDSLLEANGGKLKECKFFISGPGVCMGLVHDETYKNRNLIQKDKDGVCADDERCLPCINPQTNEDTKLCGEIGVYEKACQGGSGAVAETCCHNAGTCLNEDAVPEDQRGDLSRATCSAGKLCAPAALVDNAPTKCDVLGADGVCVDLCFAGILGPAGIVIRSSCRSTEVCVPCVVGKGQGLPGCD